MIAKRSRKENKMNCYYWIRVLTEEGCVYTVGGLNFDEMVKYVLKLKDDFSHLNNVIIEINAID